jgi:hypothetical protein
MISENQQVIDLVITMDKRCKAARRSAAAMQAAHAQIGCCQGPGPHTLEHSDDIADMVVTQTLMIDKLDAFVHMVLVWFKPEEKLMEAVL